MNYLGIEASVRNLPELDRDFFPLYKFNHAFLASAQKPVGVAVERSGGEMASVHTFIHGTPDRIEADRYYIRRPCENHAVDEGRLARVYQRRPGNV